MAASPEERARKRRVRELFENPAFFLARAANPTPSTELTPSAPITSYSGRIYVAVNRAWADDPLGDPNAWTGVCDAHPQPPSALADDDFCRFEAVSFIVALTRMELLSALRAGVMRALPDFGLAEANNWVSSNFVAVPLVLERVRLASLLDDPALKGAELRPRRESQGPPVPEAKARVREMLDRGAALVLIPGEGRNPGLERLLVFTVPSLRMLATGSIHWGKPEPFPKLPSSGQALGRDAKLQKSAERWRARGTIVSELRNIVALVRELAEAVIAAAKAWLLLVALLAGPPAALMLIYELLRSR